MLSKRFLLVGALSGIVALTLILLLLLQPWNDNNGGPQRYTRAAVASNGFECASIGRGILERDGSAADAVIATMFCEGISCAQCMGLGGGFLATYYDAPTGQVRVLNARERAPAATFETMYDNASSTVGGLAVAVPGELLGYGELHSAYGRLPWADLVRPSAELCRQGHRVTEYMGRVLASNADLIKEEPSLSEVYVNPSTGEVYREGDIIRLPRLAETLDIIAAEGPNAMHNGSLTSAFVADIQSFGGIVTESDMRNYRPVWQDPISVEVTDDHTLYSVPLPGTGSVLAFILNMARSWVGTSSGPVAQANIYWHRLVEIFKYAYAKRTGLGDPNRTNLLYNVSELEANLSSAAWAQSYRHAVDDSQTFSSWTRYGALFDLVSDHGTAHASVVAPDGSAVAATSTINYIWGALIRSQSTGIILNNEMDDFAIPGRASVYDLPPSPANMLAPGLQPLSSMVPSIVVDRDGQVDLVVGAAGGTRITTQVAMMTMKILQDGEQLADVMQQPRIHHQLVPMEVQHEIDFDPVVLDSLQRRGHTLTVAGVAGFAAAVAVARDDQSHLVPMTDPRRIGSIDGLN